jgi:hypothetical protein
VSFLESTKLKELAEKSILSSKQEFVTKNPTFAAKLANQLAESRVLYLFSSHEERLELSETQFNAVMGALEVQAIESAVEKEPAPKIKWCRYSKFGDTGYLGCQSVEDAKLIMAGVLKVEVNGIKFRAWAKEELESRHLVSIDISIHQSNLGAPMVMKGFMAANTLQGKATKVRIVKVGGWCKVTRALYDTLKFFADDQLYEQLNERKNGDKGRRLYLIVGTGERQVHLSQQPGVAIDLEKTAAEIEAIKISEAEAEAEEESDMDIPLPLNDELEPPVEPQWLPNGNPNPKFVRASTE